MAWPQKIAKLLSHVRACHNARLPGERLPFCVGDALVGYVLPDFAARLAGVSVATGRVVLAASAAGRLNDVARAAGVAFRGEDFDVRAVVDGPVLGVLDRGALPAFGVMGVGVHLNGLVRRDSGWWLWVARRAADKKLDPGKLDHLVAGGVPAGFSAFETLVKEAAEEAGLPAELVGRAVEVGRFGYACERAEGLRRDFLVAYDLVLPEDFVPVAADGEVAGFELWPLQRVFEVAGTTDDFKFNVNLVLVDLFVRYGLVAGEDAAALRRALAGEVL
jgi:8-oxo-dGTP pyrophosphatase MutT (NUDIX family)